MTDERFDKMLYGDVECIEEGLASNCVTDRINAIISAVKNRIETVNVIELLKKLRGDNERIYLQNPDMIISKFAIASLVLLGKEKYEGDDEFIIELISSNLGISN